MIRITQLIIGIVILLIFFNQVNAANLEKSKTLIAISLKQVKKILETNKHDFDYEIAYNLAWITTPKAFIVDNQQDLIFIGERDASAHSLSINDLSIAFKNIVLSSSNQSPGITIDFERDENGRPSNKWSKAKYFGHEVENTRWGKVFFESDILLKLFSINYESPRLENIPSTWDLTIHRLKCGYRQYPWIQEGSRSYFFPTHVKVILGKNNQSVSLHSVRISVMTQAPTYFQIELQRYSLPASIVQQLSSISLEELKNLSDLNLKQKFIEKIGSLLMDKSITGQFSVNEIESYKKYVLQAAQTASNNLLNEKMYVSEGNDVLDSFMKNKTHPSVVSAKLLTQHYPKIEKKFPVLQDYRHIIELLALVRSCNKMKYKIELTEWLNTIKVKHDVKTPKRIPVVEREIRGFACSYGFMGGLSTTYTLERAFAGNPSALRKVVLRYRPSSRSLYWTISTDNNLQVSTSELNKLSLIKYFSEKDKYEANKKYRSNVDLSVKNDEWSNWKYFNRPGLPKKTPEWKTSTDGDQLFEIQGEFSLGTNGELYRPDMKFGRVSVNKIVSTNYNINSRYVYKNKVEFSLNVPFNISLYQVPDEMTKQEKLPGLVDFNFVGGISNISLGAKYAITDGTYDFPYIALNFNYCTPINLDIISNEELSVGIDGWYLSLMPEATILLTNKLFLNLFTGVEFSKVKPYGSKEIKETKTSKYYGISPHWLINKKWAYSIGGNYVIINHEDVNIQKIELFVGSSSKYRISKTLIGAYLYKNEYALYWQMNLFSDALFFRKSWWF